MGLTGGIATGKSTCTEWLRKHGASVIDFDKIAREVVKPGSPVLKRIKEEFGDWAVNAETGELERKKLGDHIFGNPERRKALDRIMQAPLRINFVLEAFERFFCCCLRKDAPRSRVVVVDAPLLFEHGLDGLCWQTLTVGTDERTQLERLMRRDQCDESAARARITSQMPIRVKRERATKYIDNNGSIDDLHKKLSAWWKQVNAESWSLQALLIPSLPAVFVSSLFLTILMAAGSIAFILAYFWAKWTLKSEDSREAESLLEAANALFKN